MINDFVSNNRDNQQPPRISDSIKNKVLPGGGLENNSPCCDIIKNDTEGDCSPYTHINSNEIANNNKSGAKGVIDSFQNDKSFINPNCRKNSKMDDEPD